MRVFITSLRMLGLLSLLTGLLYPLLITLAGRFFWPKQAYGSLIHHDKRVLGSALLAQKFDSERYFHPRPSSTDYGTQPTGASNLAPTSKALYERIQRDTTRLRSEAASEGLLTTSASGLDPHLPPEAINLQVERIARARGLTPEQVRHLKGLITSATELPLLGFIGKRVINVLKLNIALDEMP